MFILWSLQIWVYVIIGPFGKSQLVLIYWNYRYFCIKFDLLQVRCWDLLKQDAPFLCCWMRRTIKHMTLCPSVIWNREQAFNKSGTMILLTWMSHKLPCVFDEPARVWSATIPAQIRWETKLDSIITLCCSSFTRSDSLEVFALIRCKYTTMLSVHVHVVPPVFILIHHVSLFTVRR